MGASVSTQKLPKYSISPRRKLTLPQHVVGKIGTHFLPELQNAGKAELFMFSNEGSPSYVVTASLQKLRKQEGNGVRVVLLESGWMPIVRELQLREGDTVRISLLSKRPWTYSIEVERAAEADQIEEVDAMDEDVVPPTRMIPDLNEPVPLDEEINLNQAVRKFDLNEPAHPDV